jgi:hypothetical protein
MCQGNRGGFLLAATLDGSLIDHRHMQHIAGKKSRLHAKAGHDENITQAKVGKRRRPECITDGKKQGEDASHKEPRIGEQCKWRANKEGECTAGNRCPTHRAGGDATVGDRTSGADATNLICTAQTIPEIIREVAGNLCEEGEGKAKPNDKRGGLV